MDGMKLWLYIIVMGVMNWLNFIDLVFCWFGCFDCEIDIGVSDEVGRFEVLRIYIKNMKFDEVVDLEKIFKEMYGYVGVDLVVFFIEVVF